MITLPSMHAQTMNAQAPAPTGTGTGTTTTSGSGLPTSQGLDTMFLQLLVAQLQNQSPLGSDGSTAVRRTTRAI